jgi:C-terminal processing protease CtpA/Prc
LDRLTAAGYIREVLENLSGDNVDLSNVPLSEAEERRLAWMGIELQPLNKELARINKVSELTNDGETGALVSYIYPGSPADEAGIEPGYVLLRLHVPDRPKPIDVRVGSYVYAETPFPWAKLDELPEQYYDQVPKPWSPAENSFRQTLREIGFDKPYTAEFFHNGQPIRKEFVCAKASEHFDSAASYKKTDIGMTVRDMTFEVRRYFQKATDDPGVIVSKIEPGSKASVAGLKPYEIITHVNDAPVSDVAAFENLIAGQDELALTVKRMTKGRMVKITMPSAAGTPSTQHDPQQTETQPAQ